MVSNFQFSSKVGRVNEKSFLGGVGFNIEVNQTFMIEFDKKIITTKLGKYKSIDKDSTLLINGTLTIASNNVIFAGTNGFNCNNISCAISGATITLASGKTYNVTNNLNLVGTIANKILLRSLTTPRAIFTLPYGATQNVKNTSATNIDSSLGQTVLSSAGVLTNTLNWSIGSGNFFLMF